MKKLFVGLLAIASMALVGCSQDEEQLQFGGATFEDFTGEIVSEQTRTSMGADGSVLWSEDDLISLFKKTGYHQNYVVKSYGSASTTFEWVDASTSLGFKPTMNYAAYPYNANNTISGTTLTLDLSSLATQNYTANTFENAKAVMVAKSATTNLAFTNAFSLANIKLTADCGANPAPDETIYVKSIKIESATLPLAGNATVDMSQDKPAAAFASEGAKSITLTCAEPIQLSATATNFYILMPAVTFPANDLTITVQADIAEEAKECVIEVGNEVAFLRSQVTTLNKTITLDAWTGSTEITTVTVDNATEATEALENNAGVKLNDATGTSEIAPITVPAKDAVAAEVEHVIDLSSADMGTTPVYIAVEEGDASTTTTVKELEVIVPAGTTASSLNINAPGTTVTVTTADGTIIDTITAITAENTLIIAEGVTINKLNINGGNVRIEGGIVKEVANDLKKDITYVVKTAEQMRNIPVFATEVILAADIDLNNEQWISIGTPENPFSGTLNGMNHTIKNLKVVETEAKEGKAYIGLFGYAKDATIKDVTFENVNINIPCLDIDHSQGHIGAVAGSLEGTSTIENVTVKGDIKVEATVSANGASRVAVVAGGNSYGNVTMKNVHVIANAGSYLKANNNTGALAGQLQGKNVFENCSSNIDVTVTKFFAGGIIGLAAGDSKFTNCHTTGNVTVTAGREGRHNDEYRVGGIAGGWADGKKNVCTLIGCSYTGRISGKNADGAIAEPLDYAGFVGRGYTLNGCAGSKVVIDGVEYIEMSGDASSINYLVIDNGVIHVKDAANLKNAAEVGGTIVLEKDIDMGSEILVLGKNTVLDGNGKTLISKAGRAINVSGAEDVTIKNLTITCTGERGINVIQNAKEVTIKNVTATAANYTVNVASSAPAAKVVINNSTLNGLCVVNVCGEGADVTVDGSIINCLDKNQTAGEAYAALSLNMESIGGKIIATNTTINVEAGSDSCKGRNSAEDGVVTIDGSTEDVVVMVAAIKSNPSDVYYYTNASLAEAVEFAKNGDIITLIRDVELSESITIERDVTINLNGNKLTANVNKGRAFDIVANDVEFTLNATDSQIEFGNGTYGIIQFKDDATGNKVVVNGGTFEGTTDAGAFVRYRSGKKNTLVLNNVNYKDNCAVQGKNANNPFVISTNGAPADNENSITINGGNYDAACFIATVSKDFSMKDATITATGLGLELKNGTIENSTINLNPGAYVYSIDGAGLIASYSGEVTIKGSTINVSGNYYGIAVAPTGGSVNVEDCAINATTKYFVYDQYEGKSGCIKEGNTVVAEK